MKRRVLTKGSLEVSDFIAGFWRQNDWGFSDAQLHAYVEGLLELGITTMDHAFVYQSEQQFGRVLAKAPSLRERMEIISKFGIRITGLGALGASRLNHYDNSAEYLVSSVEKTLGDLNTDCIDVLLVHRPDYLMDVESLAKGFCRLLEQGKVKHFGVSNFSVSQFDLLQSACDMALVTNQIEFSPHCLDPLDNGVLDQCQRLNMSPLYWSCLDGGRIITGNDERSIRVRIALQAVADDVGAETLEQVVYAWVKNVPCAGVPIIGTSKLERVKNAIGAQKIKLNREQWYSILNASNGCPLP